SALNSCCSTPRISSNSMVGPRLESTTLGDSRLLARKHGHERLGFEKHARKARSREQTFEVSSATWQIGTERVHLVGVKQRRSGGAVSQAEVVANGPTGGPEEVLGDSIGGVQASVSIRDAFSIAVGL